MISKDNTAERLTIEETDVSLAVIFRHDDAAGRMDARIVGYLDPDELVYQLRAIADHIEKNGPVDGGDR